MPVHDVGGDRANLRRKQTREFQAEEGAQSALLSIRAHDLSNDVVSKAESEFQRKLDVVSDAQRDRRPNSRSAGREITEDNEVLGSVS